jgi:hypothetical protein
MEVGVAFARPTPWGVIWGWLPALVGTMTLMWITSEQNTTSQDAQTGDHDTPQATPGRKTTLMIVGLVVAAAAAVVIASPLAEKAYRAANLARPMPVPSADPTVIGSPTISYAVDPNVAPDWCSQDVLLEPGFQDAATGHRSRTITITNTGAASCVLEGYPDVAFNDGGGNAMDVLMVRGGSFLTDDPGPTRIVLHPGASAEAYLGWSAVAGQSEVSAGTVLLAPYAGAQRQPTPMPLDINNGQPVAMTAWGQVRTADGD